MNITNRYILQIVCKNHQDTIFVKNLLLGDGSLNMYKEWENLISISDCIFRFEVVESTGDNYFDFINNFLDILEGNYSSLEEIIIIRNDITIWYYGIFDNQCNMEFSSKRMKRLGDNEIDLCLSLEMG